MAEKAGNAADKASWLRLAASWLGMIKDEPRRFLSAPHQDGQAEAPISSLWPIPSDKDSKVSH